MKEQNKFWKYANMIAFLLINALYFALAIHEVFGYDEAYTVGMIYRDFSDIIYITSNDVHTPFYYFVLKIFFHTLGMNELISIKIFSWIFMTAYLVFGMKVCLKHYNAKVCFFWLILSGLIPSMLIQATNARMYTLGMFCVSVASYLAYSLYKDETRKKWIAFTVATIIAIYIHTFTMIEMVVVYLLFIIAVIAKKRYKTLRSIVVSGVIVSVSYIPWLLVLIKQFRRWAGIDEGWGNTIQEFGWPLVQGFFVEWFSSADAPHPKGIAFVIVMLLICGIFSIIYCVKSKDYLPCLGIGAACIVLFIACMVSAFIVPCFLGRYLFPLFGGVWLFVAVGLNRIKFNIVQWGFVAGIIVCGMVTFGEELKLEDETGLNNYRAFLVNELGENDVIMTDTYVTMMMSIYAPEEEYMIYGGKQKGMPFDNCESFTRWEQLEGIDVVWYLSVEGFRAGNLNGEYDIVETRVFPFSYYNVILEKYVKRAE